MSKKKPYSDDVKFLHYRAYDETQGGKYVELPVGKKYLEFP